MSLERIRKLHRPGTNRVEISGIILDAPACQECKKAHPCPTVLLTESKHHEQNH